MFALIAVEATFSKLQRKMRNDYQKYCRRFMTNYRPVTYDTQVRETM